MVIKMLVELHSHSTCSDGINTAEEMIETALKRGIGALAITDHNSFKGYEAAKKLKPKILLIPGAEISTDNGHVLCIGITELKFKKYDNANEVIDKTHAAGGLAIIAHPFRIWKSISDKEIFKQTDAIEVINGNTPKRYNMMALHAAEQHKKPKTSGSDAHRRKDVGSFAFSVQAYSMDDILKRIKKSNIALPNKHPALASLAVKIIDRRLHRIFMQ